ncbi:hypothetical protein Aduo_006907 [Ancylostoma duodenale]
MKTLIAVLALCALAYSHDCQKRTQITQNDINNVDSVTYVTVTRDAGRFYFLQYDRYFDVPHQAPNQYQTYGTIRSQGCKLNVDTEYILGCKSDKSYCFARPVSQLTADEKSLLKW